MAQLNLFSTPIYISKFEDSNKLKSTISNIIQRETPSVNTFNPRLEHYFQDKDIFENEKLNPFKEFILINAKKYIKQTLGYKIDDLIITDCWLNVCKNGGYQVKHNHGNSFISGTYYVNLNKNHPNLTFHSSAEFNNRPFLELDIETPNEYNTKEYTVDNINEGELLFWPSHLPHSYGINNGEERVSISMNILPNQLKVSNYSFSISR